MSSASAFETQSTRKAGRGQVMYKTKYSNSLSSNMVNVFGDTSGPEIFKW